MKKTIILTLIIAILLFFFSFYFYLVDKKIISRIGSSVEKDDKTAPKNPLKDIDFFQKNYESSIKNQSTDENITTSGLNKEEKKIPDDLYNASCGFYFKDYGVCAGTCPQGECVNEERSCYCKKK